MTFDQVLLLLLLVSIPIASFYIKESIRQTFQQQLATLQAVYDYKQLAIKSSFEETTKLNDILWTAYWAHQDLWTYDRMSQPERDAALKAILGLREFLFSHQIFFDAEIYENAVRAMANMSALSRFRAANRQPPEQRTGRDTEMETDINDRLANIVRLIRTKFQLPAVPADLRVPERLGPLD